MPGLFPGTNIIVLLSLCIAVLGDVGNPVDEIVIGEYGMGSVFPYILSRRADNSGGGACFDGAVERTLVHSVDTGRIETELFGGRRATGCPPPTSPNSWPGRTSFTPAAT